MTAHRSHTLTYRVLATSVMVFMIVSLFMPIGSFTGAVRAAAVSPQAAGDTAGRLPFERIGHSTILDEPNDRLILFGGFNGRSYFNDVWALSLAHGSEAWTRLNPDGLVPAPRAFHSAIYDAAHDRMIVFGGRSPSYTWDDVWALDLSTPGQETWTQIDPAGLDIRARRWHTALYDEPRDRMIVFGGQGRTGLYNDVWALSLTPGSETWSPLAVTGSVPTARAQHTAIYSDTAQGLMVVFGGVTTGALLDDTWALNLTTLAWAQIAQAEPHPSARRGHTAIFNFVGNPVRMEVFGGQDSSGFLNDGWALKFTPGNIHWEQFTYYSAKPSARAWHSAVFSEMNPYQTTVLGGRGAEPTNGAQWALNMSGSTWSPITPTLPGWAQFNLPTAISAAGSQPTVSVQIEDAQPDTVVNLLPGSEVWFVVKLKSATATYASNITATLTVNTTKLGITQVGTRHTDWDDVTWRSLGIYPNGQYKATGLSLEKRSGETQYSTQVIFKAVVAANAAEGSTSINLDAYAANWATHQSDNATARIQRDPQAWIVTNRTRLFGTYTNAEVQNLLNEVFEQAQGSGYNSNPTGVVLYADRAVAGLKTWDNRTVNYASDITANTVSSALDTWLDGWAVAPDYLVMLGDDNVVPFYRKHAYGTDGVKDQSEDDHPDCWGDAGACDQLVAHNFHLTDNPYGDVGGGTDWETGDLEIAVGRIVGATAADMQLFLHNSAQGPNAANSRAVVASDGLDWWLTGADNDAHDILKDDLGYTLNESLIDQTATKAQIVAEMQSGFTVAALAHHGETYVWDDPDPADQSFDDNYLVSYELPTYDTSNRMSTNRPFFYFNACRIGLSYTDGWNAGQPGVYDDTLIYALVHRGASGIVASAGLGYGCFTANQSCSAEILGNTFWVETKAQPDRSDPLGWALMRAKDKHPVNGNITEKKTVQTFTYFGVPWMRLPGHGSLSANAAPQGTDAWSKPVLLQPDYASPAAIQATYVVTAHIDASGYTTATTTDGFNLVEMAGMEQRLENGELVVPRAVLELVLPLSATVSSVIFTPTLPVTLTGLNLPTLISGVPIPGGATGGYTTTLAGTYPATVTLAMLNLGSYQVARFSVIPIGYNATTDVARLYQSIDLHVEYDTPQALALTAFTANRLRYLPGEPITITANLYNAGSAAETVTPTLLIVNPQEQVTGTLGSALVVPTGASYELTLGYSGYLDGDTYLARLLLEQGGEVVAGAGRQVFVSEGAISGLSAPSILLPGQTGTFTVTFQNYTAYTTTAIASLSIFDTDDTLLAFLTPTATSIAGGGNGTFSFAWSADRPGPFTVSTVVMAGGEEYGPVSAQIGGGLRVFLPVVLKS